MKPRHLAVAGAMLVLTASMQAALTHDYFEYGSTDGSLAGLTTSDTTGWDADTWSGDSDPLYITTNDPIVFVASNITEAVGYANTIAGGCLRGDNGSIGTITRGFANPLADTVWISVVVSNSWWNSPPGFTKNHVQFLINGNPDDSFGAMCTGNSTTYGWFVYENGVFTSNAYDGAMTAAPVLLVVKLRTDYSGSDDELTLWLLPYGEMYPTGRTVADLGSDSYVTATAQDIWGDSITNIGITILAQSDTRNIQADSLRISYGNITDDMHVYEVLSGTPIPEPVAAVAVLALGIAAVVRVRGSGFRQ